MTTTHLDQPATSSSGTTRAADDTPIPRRVVVRGVPITLALLPEAAPRDRAEPTSQPMLPLQVDAVPESTGVDADRARARVAALGRVVAEVLDRRRPLGQLRGVLDDESLALLAAWTRLGVLQRSAPGPVQVMVVSPTHLEASFTLRTHQRNLAVVVALERVGDQWACSMLRILAPDALVSRRAA